MVKKIIFVILFIGSTSNLKAQVYLNNLYKQANEMAVSLPKGDYKTLMKYTHPTIIKKMGGIEKAISTLKKGMTTMQQQGFQINKVTIGKVTQTIKSQKDIQCIVPQILDLKFGGQSVHTTSYLFCISYDGGKRWYFLDAGTMPEAQLRQTFPEISSKLIIPKSARATN